VTEAAGHGGPNALQKLILEAKHNENCSYVHLANRAGLRDNGQPWINKSQIQKFATRPLKRPPRAEAVVGLALALRVSKSVVRAAVGESLRYRDPVPGERGGFSYAHALADRVDAIPDGEDRGRVLWAWEHLLRGVEPRPAPSGRTADELSRTAEALLDALPRLSAAARRRLLDVLDEVAGGDVTPDGENGEDEDGPDAG
jgi:hypothetical protein